MFEISLKRKIYCYDLSKMSLWDPFHFTKDIERMTTKFCFFSFLLSTFQNAARIVRALFEIALRKRWPAMTYRLLNLSKVIDKRLWGWVSPLRQFSVLPPSVLSRLEEKNLTIDKLKDMRKDEIGEKPARLICLNYSGTNGRVRTESEPCISIPSLVWKPCSHVPHIDMVCLVKKMFSSVHSL